MFKQTFIYCRLHILISIIIQDSDAISLSQSAHAFVAVILFALFPLSSGIRLSHPSIFSYRVHEQESVPCLSKSGVEMEQRKIENYLEKCLCNLQSPVGRKEIRGKGRVGFYNHLETIKRRLLTAYSSKGTSPTPPTAMVVSAF